MSSLIHRIGVCCLLAAIVSSASALAQNPASGARPAPTRRPFAKAGTPQQTERIRFFDIIGQCDGVFQ